MSNAIKDPSEAWNELKDNLGDLTINEIIERIKKIDTATPWCETEPSWWLEMIDTQRDCYRLVRLKNFPEKNLD